MENKSIDALEVHVPDKVLDELSRIYLPWMFGNKEETYHIIIDVDWLLESEEANPECDDVENAVETLTEVLGDSWRKTKLLYLKGEKSI